MAKKWYIIHTYAGHENKVKMNLEKVIEHLGLQDKISPIIIPTEEVIEFKKNEKRIVPKKKYPGYILIEMEMDDEIWYVIRNIQGVTGFIGSKGESYPIPEEEVKQMLGLTGETKPKPKVAWEKGEPVQIITGPFEDFTGVVEEVNAEQGKLKVLLSIFGRETPVEIEFDKVKKI